MLNRYREVEKCKADIAQFKEIAEKDIEQLEEKDVTALIKGMLFVKKIYAYPDNNKKHYYDCMVTDMLNLIHSFSLKSVRVYYTTYRSLIENFIRVILRYENTNATGVRNMFNEFRDKYQGTEKAFIDYIEGEYGKCCEVVHSNCKAVLPIYEYYEEIVNLDELSKNKMISLSRQLVDFYLKCKQFIVSCDCKQVNDAFHNQKEVLNFLLGEKTYESFLKNNEK